MSYFNDISFINIDKRRKSYYDSDVIINRDYSIEYIKEGSIILVTNGKRCKLSAPIVFWMLPGNTYQFLTVDEKPVEHFWVDFYGSRAERMLESISQRIPNGMIQITRTLELETIFENMIKIYNKFSIGKRQKAVVGLEQLAEIIYSSVFDVAISKKHRYDFIEELAQEMKISPQKSFDLKKISKKNGLSYHRFRKLFRDYNHIAPHDYLIACRMDYAAKIIKEKNIPINELAVICGFNEISCFSRMFKKKMGLSPKNYAKAIKSR